MTKPKILFFARGFQADFFPALASDADYESVFVTMIASESARVRRNGFAVEACFEESFPSLQPAPLPSNYLYTSLMADRFLGRFDHNRRIEILGKEIAFWSELLDRLKPAAVVNELVAIEISEVLLIECRKRGIPYLAAMNCVVQDYFYWLPDPMSISGTLLSLPEPSPEAKAAARAYMQELAAKDYKPFYVRKLSGRRALKPLVAAAAKGLLWWYRARREKLGGPFIYEMYDDEYGKKLSVFAKHFLLRYDELDDLPKDAEVVFFPLHQEPEATLNYMSTFYSNQICTIENILKSLGPHQVLVIKEHPVDKGSLLQRKYLELRRRHSNLYYIPAEVHGRQVLDRAGRVVTLTSTVGWEAALIGKKVYVLGEIFYDCLDGIEKIRHFRHLRDLLRNPIANRVDPASAEHFVAQMVEMSYPGNPIPGDDLYADVNLQRTIAAIKHAACI